MPFNPEMKKKKKKKKPMLDADGGFMAEPEEGTSAVPQEPTEVKEEEKSVKNTDDFGNFDSTETIFNYDVFLVKAPELSWRLLILCGKKCALPT